jgi:hypothetical protein
MENDLIKAQPPARTDLVASPPGARFRWDPFTIRWTLWFVAAGALVGLAVTYPDLRPLLLALAERMPR